MNNVKSKEKNPKSGQHLQKLSLSIGNFILYWGFRRIHGAIWTQLYLSKVPLSCTELALNLGVSKSLVSPALVELCGHKLIFEAAAPNEKTKIYETSKDINAVIRHVLKTREAKLLNQINQDFSSFKKKEAASENIHQEHLNSLEEMIVSANLMLEIVMGQENLMKHPLGLG